MAIADARVSRASVTHLDDPHSRRRLRIHGSIARDIGIGIVSGVYPPGFLFETELVASDALKVSRTAYREALRILTAKGLVASRPKLGTRVTDPGQWNLLDADVLNWIFADYPSDELVRMLFELRAIVEPRIAALAAARRSPQQLGRMRQAMATLAQHGFAGDQGRAADVDFHRALLDAAGNLFLKSLGQGVIAAVELTTLHKHREGRLARDATVDHQAVLDAVVAGDTFAAHSAMSRLIDLALHDMLPNGGAGAT